MKQARRDSDSLFGNKRGGSASSVEDSIDQILGPDPEGGRPDSGESLSSLLGGQITPSQVGKDREDSDSDSERSAIRRAEEGYRQLPVIFPRRLKQSDTEAPRSDSGLFPSDISGRENTQRQASNGSVSPKSGVKQARKNSDSLFGNQPGPSAEPARPQTSNGRSLMQSPEPPKPTPRPTPKPGSN
jgi:hypothetical protein